MNEFGVHNGVEYEVSDTRAELKKIYFNNTNTGETFTRLLRNVTEERIKEYIDNRILFTYMEETLIKYFDNKSTVVFRSSSIFDRGEAITCSREINARIKKSNTEYCDIGSYRISIYNSNKSRQKKYKAEMVRCDNDN